MIKLDNPNSFIESYFLSPTRLSFGNIFFPPADYKGCPEEEYFIFQRCIKVRLKKEFNKFDIIPFFDLSDNKLCKRYIVKNKHNISKGSRVMPNDMWESYVYVHKIEIVDNNFDSSLYLQASGIVIEHALEQNSFYVEDKSSAMKIKLLS